ncbi:hypothetical protein BaRGS_00010174 [Batillaria attramentaria]|uniref:Uncharacterized protein n=1 Tax=Batillaria attramentaria TaxID=370345 RepID=A0ABD0LGB2_9CAEN
MMFGFLQDVMLMQLSSDVKFPLQVSMNLLFINPSGTLPLPSLAVPPPPVVCVPTPSTSGIKISVSSATTPSSSSAVSAATDREGAPGTSESDCSSIQSDCTGAPSEFSIVQRERLNDQTGRNSGRQRTTVALLQHPVQVRPGEPPSTRGNCGASWIDPDQQGCLVRPSVNNNHIQPPTEDESPNPSGGLVSGAEGSLSVAPVSQNSSFPSSEASSSSASEAYRAISSAVAQLRDIRDRESRQHAASCSVSPASNATSSAAAVVSHAAPTSSSARRHASKSIGNRRMPRHSRPAASS